MIYRDWVRKEASWYPREKIDDNGRTDSPQWLKEQCLWAMYRVDPKEMVPAMKKMQAAFGVPAAVHWYYWHQNPYDNDYPHFFPKEGFKEAVAELQKDGNIFVMPYINGLLWDSRDKGTEDWLFTKEALPGTSKDIDGNPIWDICGSKEKDGSDVVLSHMCPTTPVWQNKVSENVLRLADECGVKAVYVDQVAACIPELCFDRSHGHPLGGGHWWSDGYRDMFDKMKKELQDRKVEDLALTTECTGEVSLPLVDAFLTWHHQLQDQVPAFAAVYGGAIQMIGRDYRAGKTYAERTKYGMKNTNEPLACRMKAADALCFGEQIGWFVPTIVDEPDKFPFLKKIVQLRYQFRHYFYRGEMCRVPDLSAGVPVVTADWDYYGSPWISAPAIRTSCWRIVKDSRTQSLVLLFVNTSSEKISAKVHLNLSESGIDPDNIVLAQINPDGSKTTLKPDCLNQPVDFEGESVFAYEISTISPAHTR
jgi:hypothetical protein